MQGTENAFVPVNSWKYSGWVSSLRELKRKDGSTWGHSVVIGQNVGVSGCEFLIPFKDWERLGVGEAIEVRGHLEQDGYQVRQRVDQIGRPTPAAQPEPAKKSA